MNHFVFVICGSKEHTDKLNFSLKFLRHFSNADIVVVTDTTRNENKIEHDRIIDIKTPEKFTHHQASIYLKTGLFKFISIKPNDTYCYLDSDIIAVSKACDQVFAHHKHPVSFAKDHNVFSSFSPYAMRCKCLSNYKKRKEEFNSAMKTYFDDYEPGTTESMKHLNALNAIFTRYKKHPLRHVLRILNYLVLRYIAPVKAIKLENYTFNKQNRCWYNEKGNMISFDYKYHRKKLYHQQGIFYKDGNWYNRYSDIITPQTPKCHHLQAYISHKYKVNIPQDWQHWNGGVFLFDRHAKSFMEYWHKISIVEFKCEETKTRDQATLAVSVWKFGLQHHITLPEKFNFIAEYANTDIKWCLEKGYTFDDYKSSFSPAFLHIYHHWGDKSWSIWQSVIQKGKENNII